MYLKIKLRYGYRYKMTSNPLISVVIPAYNREATIIYCLQSVLNQTYRNLEVLVVDDGSTDTTIEKVKQIIDKRIRLIKMTKNSGAQAARNLGIKRAKGQWIAFLDSDDYWFLDKLEKQVKLLDYRLFDYRTVVHSDCNIQKNGKIIDEWFLSEAAGQAYKQLLTYPSPMFQGLVVSKRHLKEIGFLDENVPSYQEWDTAIRLAKNGFFIHMREPTFVYCFHDGPTISKNSKRDIEGYLYIVEKHKQSILENLGAYQFDDHIVLLINRSIEYGLSKVSIELTSKLICRYCRWWLKCSLILSNIFGSRLQLFILRVFRFMRYRLRTVLYDSKVEQ